MAEEVTAPTELNTEDILSALNTDDSADETGNEDDKPEPKLKAEEAPDEDDDSEKAAEIEVEGKEPKIEDIDELNYDEVPQRKAILAKYPDFFKEFKGVERAIYREDAYTKIFPSIKTAEEAKSDVDTFNQLKADIFNGDISNVLQSVKQSDPKAFGKITATLLQTLNNVDRQAHSDVVNHVMKSALSAVSKHAAKLGGDTDSDGGQLALAAKILNRFIYGSDEIEEPKIPEVKTDPRDEEISKERQAFNKERLDAAVKDVSDRVERSIKFTVGKHIDPKGSMTEYVKNKSIEDVMNAVYKEYNTDSRFRNHLDGLWKSAQKDNYSEASKSTIREALIKKAQSVLNGHIKYVRQAATKGNNAVRKVVKKDEDDEPVTRSQARPNNNSSSKPNRVGGVSDVMAFLDKNVR